MVADARLEQAGRTLLEGWLYSLTAPQKEQAYGQKRGIMWLCLTKALSSEQAVFLMFEAISL